MKGGGSNKSPLILALLAILAISAPHALRAETDTSSENDTKREACIRACNSEHALCGESEATRFDGADMPSGMIGAAAACDQSLRQCLKSCK